MTAQGTPAQPVQTILVQKETSRKARPARTRPGKESNRKESGRGKASNNRSSHISITAAQLTYADSERRVHYDGGVVAKGTDFTASAKTLDAYLLPRSQTSTQSVALPAQDNSTAWSLKAMW